MRTGVSMSKYMMLVEQVKHHSKISLVSQHASVRTVMQMIVLEKKIDMQKKMFTREDSLIDMQNQINCVREVSNQTISVKFYRACCKNLSALLWI